MTTGGGHYFPTGNEFADDVFENATYIAFLCGATAGCSENALLRDHFIGNEIAMLAGDANALNHWIWYSTFQGNSLGAGIHLVATTVRAAPSMYMIAFSRALPTRILQQAIRAYGRIGEIIPMAPAPFSVVAEPAARISSLLRITQS